MKVLIAHNFYRSHQQGGEDVVVHQEVAALKKQLGETNVFTYFVYNDTLKMLPLLKNIWGNRQHAKNIVNLIKQNKIDILHIHNDFPLLTPLIIKAAKSQHCKVVQTLHNFRNQCLAGTLYQSNQICEKCVNQSFKWKGILHRCYRDSYLQSFLHALAQKWYRYRAYHNDIDHYFALSSFQKNKLISFGIAKEKLILKPNFVKQPLNIIETLKRKNYLFIGRIESGKGIELLLKTWMNLPNYFILKIIGIGPSLTRLKKIYYKENIHFLGAVSHEETMNELKQSKYLVHPSQYYETFGLTLIEALSHGIPVIGFSIGTRPEFIKNGENGFLCTKDTLHETLLSSMKYVDYCHMSQKATDSAEPFRESLVILQQINYYKSILKGNLI